MIYRALYAVQQVDRPLIVGSPGDDLFARRPEEDGMFELSSHGSARRSGKISSRLDDPPDATTLRDTHPA